MTHQPRTIYDFDTGENAAMFWDRNGNLAQIISCVQNSARLHEWDEENRLRFVLGDSYAGYYGYDANGERVYKLIGTNTTSQLNSANPYAQAIFDDAVLYPNPYMVVTQRGYTKHYYAGTERLATVIGGGGLGDMEFPIDHNMTQHEKEVIDVFYNQYQTDDPFWQGMVMSYPVPTEDIEGEQRGELEYLCPPTILDYVDVQFKWDILLGSIMQYTQANGPENEVYFYHGDHLGSANWITDYTGAPIQYIHYAPYGELIDNQQATQYDERYKFTGKERDWETGYDYFGARYWWLGGTWLSVDPLADKYPNISPYAYAAWNPINRIDPDGRADYYDVDGNHLCTDGVDDRKVYQQSDKGDKVLGGYAMPFSYVGDVDNISLSYDGEMISDSKSQGTLTVTQHVGDKQFSRGFSAISGNGSIKKGNALYTLQNGDYICSGYASYNPREVGKAFVSNGIAFGISLLPDGWDTQRKGLMIHPDGNPPGTAGCIGLTGTASELSLFQKMVSPFTSGGNTSSLSVSINGNPQCCRAVDKAKGWCVPLFSK